MKVVHDQGSDRAFKTIFKLLGRTLYDRGLPYSQKAIVDEAQAKGQIDSLQMDDPVEFFLQIVKLVAVDSLIAMVTNLPLPTKSHYLSP